MNMVCIAGAGLSTASGIPDFKGKNGLYTKKWRGHDPQEMLDIHTLSTQPELFYEFFRENLLLDNIKPNAAHHALRDLEEIGVLKSVITQNIDGLEAAAGIETVRQVHGSVHSFHCVNCGAPYTLGYIKNTTGVPRCHCGSMIRPDVVMYGETLPKDYDEAYTDVLTADILLIVGTSLSVYPVAGLVDLFNGKHIVIFNQGETSYDDDPRVVKSERPLETALPNFVKGLEYHVLEIALEEVKK